MPPANIHLIALDPGGTTGWCRLTIPAASIFGDAPPNIVEWDYGIFDQSENEQVQMICRYVRATQSLAYRIGPAVVVEGWTQDPTFHSTDPEALSPVRIGAKLGYAKFLGHLGDATLNWQSRGFKDSKAVSDERIRKAHMYVANDHILAATKHAIMALRRARQNPDLADQFWPYLASMSDAEFQEYDDDIQVDYGPTAR
jgi:hypothetical protein